MGKIAVAIMIAFLASCNLFFQTQVSFLNNTSTYTFLAIELGSVDYETALSPGAQSPWFSIAPGSYSLYTMGTNGILYQWPTEQSIVVGYSYTIIFSVNTTTNSLFYSTYVALEK